MKRILYLIVFIFTFSSASFAQDDDKGERIRERMSEYLQKRLHLTKTEAERFEPLFLNYFIELKRTNQQYRGDRLVLQQKIVDLRLRYRDQFKSVMGERRSNDVFQYERDFVDEVKRLRQERMQNHTDKRQNKKPKG
ncbi:MAG: hypothetical protein ABR502_05450 [Chitinophagaceae bacterium]